MTAFGRSQTASGADLLVWELRSVNHRYLDIHPRLPEGFRELEPTVREQVRGRIARGKVDVTLRRLEGQGGSGSLDLDEERAAAVVALGNRVSREHGTPGGLTTGEVLQWPGVVVEGGGGADEALEQARSALGEALDELMAAREREGAALAQAIEERLQGVADQVTVIRERLPEVRENYRQRLRERLQELAGSVDPERLEQELVLFAQRIDVDEELDRLDTHVAAVRESLQQGGAVGRRLDFLMQELNREANTIGSKSADGTVSQAAVDLKVLIEQMREQVQNIE
jgi:uncharacterized protein (TIGR00255 family)